MQRTTKHIIISYILNFYKNFNNILRFALFYKNTKQANDKCILLFYNKYLL